MTKEIIKLILLLLIFINTAYSQPPSIEWQKCYGGASDQYANCIQQTSDGGYITCGATATTNSNFWIVKLDAVGTELWQKLFGGSSTEVAYDIQQTTDGGYIVAGTTTSNNTGDVGSNHGSSDYWIIKLNGTGDIIWKKVFGGSAVEIVHSIQQTTDGGYIVAGESNSSNGDITGNHGMTDGWILKLDNLGNIVWQKSLGGSNNDAANCIKQTSDGGYIISGSTGSSDGDVSNPGHIAEITWIVKLDASGIIQWQKTYGSHNGGEYSFSICQASDGGYAFTSVVYANSGDVTGAHGLLDYWVVKLDASGNLIWQKALGGSSIDQPTCIIQSADGGFVVAGWTASTDGDITGNHGGADYWIVKLSSGGALLWQKAYGGSAGDQDFSICQTTDQGYIIAGLSNSNNSGDVGPNPGAPTNDFWIVKLASDVVPIILSSFDAIAKGYDVLCKWKTMQESNSNYFIIERSDDGLLFVPAGRTNATGNSVLPIDYGFTDQKALLTGKEYLYYRLKMVDMDGSFKYSTTVKIKSKHPSALSIYPTPVADQLTIYFTSEINEKVSLFIYNDAGMKVYQRELEIVKGNNTAQVNVHSLSDGGYVLSLYGQKRYFSRFIKAGK